MRDHPAPRGERTGTGHRAPAAPRSGPCRHRHHGELVVRRDRHQPGLVPHLGRRRRGRLLLADVADARCRHRCDRHDHLPRRDPEQSGPRRSPRAGSVSRRDPLIRSRTAGWVLFGLLAVALLLRAPITGVPPVLRQLSETLQLSPAQAGLVSTLPLLCFGVFAFLTPLLAARFGLESTLWAAGALIVIGIVVRWWITVPTFFGGTLIIGLGIAIGNVVVPALARPWFAHRLPLVMGLYSVMLQLGGAAGPFTTSTLVGAGVDWSVAIGVWLWPGLIALLLWTFVSLRVRRDPAAGEHRAAVPTGLLPLLRRPLVWLITFVMGTQSLVFYTMLTWLPSIFQRAGLSEHAAGLLLSAYSLLGLPGALLAGWFVGHRHAVRNLIAICTVYLCALLLLAAGTLPTVLLGAVVGGISQGVLLPIALTFIAHQPRPADVPGASAIAQGGGYLYAAAGPVLLGWLYSATGGFTAGLFVLVGLMVLFAVAGVFVSRAQQPGTPITRR
ncbi:MFS transporter [Enemella evansiae]|nr:MFS transporter [Enemella evansiae]